MTTEITPSDSVSARLERSHPHALSAGRVRVVLGQISMWICMFGYAFPIYGVTILAGLKLTLWRFGLPLLFLAAIWLKPRLQSKTVVTILGLAGVFFAVRLGTYIISTAPDKTMQQLIWYSEGWLYLLGVTLISSRRPQLWRFYFQSAFIIGLVSIGAMAVQYIGVRFGLALSLPLSNSRYGITADLRPWTYPLYGGGRIIGAFFEPNMSGSMCAFFLSMFLPFFLARRRQSLIHPWFLFLSVMVTIVALIGTGSRQAAVAGALVVVIVLFFAVWRGKRTSRTIVSWFLVVGGLVVLVVAYGLFTDITTPNGELQHNVFTRFSDVEGGDITGGRWETIQRVISELNAQILLYGRGEGSGILGAHNAYLNTLNQTGLSGLFVLMALTGYMFYASVVLTLRQKDDQIYLLGVSAVCVTSVWIALIFMNWAQLNQSLSYLFLAVPLIFLVVLKKPHADLAAQR